MTRLVFVFICIPLMLFGDDLPQIRKEYYAAITNEKAANRLYENLKKRNSQQPIIMAYYGVAQAVRARHAFNPYNKITFLRSGLKTLEAAVNKSPENLEIRYLRFSLEYYIPSFLGLSKHLDADKKKIIELSQQHKFGEMDKPLMLNLLKFMKETKRCSPQEIATLELSIKNG